MKLIQLQDLTPESVSHNREIKKRVLLRSGDLPHLTNFSQAYLSPGQATTPHAHSDMGEVFFVEAGEGTIEIDDRAYPLSPGSCIAVQPGETHKIENIGATDLVLTYFGIA
ncbi:cupin domain-containing protein [Lusitaniella coriacea LEGE 07157]|uniref:Cupin domain-containing protein n=1 Tax=Lusitaniella coriacea LEGE 07157 TaxID=945747 RepID=A0A8J7AM79_9CYAN|nr:cupin domain-containing protein [Lusitaniella coriacea]MBE9114408.1 cupin domain-containing protein [Lusitaniella coriacea LEGE 07157]